MLQTRNGKRTAQAAVKIAVDMVKEKLISKEEALLSDFDIINIDASKESFGQKNFESSLGIV